MVLSIVCKVLLEMCTWSKHVVNCSERAVLLDTDASCHGCIVLAACTVMSLVVLNTSILGMCSKKCFRAHACFDARKCSLQEASHRAASCYSEMSCIMVCSCNNTALTMRSLVLLPASSSDHIAVSQNRC